MHIIKCDECSDTIPSTQSQSSKSQFIRLPKEKDKGIEACFRIETSISGRHSELCGECWKRFFKKIGEYLLRQE